MHFWLRINIDISSSSHALRGEFDSVYNILVTSATADITRDGLANRCLIWIRIVLQERNQGHQYAGCTETALHAMRIPESFLDHVQIIGTAKALDCLDLVPIGLDSKH